MATTYAPTPGPDGERLVHHSELVRVRTVTAFLSGQVEPVRCVFRLRLDRDGVPRIDGIEQLAVEDDDPCDSAASEAAEEALAQWRFAPAWAGDGYIPVRTIVALNVSNRPSETWELPVKKRVCLRD